MQPTCVRGWRNSRLAYDFAAAWELATELRHDRSAGVAGQTAFGDRRFRVWQRSRATHTIISSSGDSAIGFMQFPDNVSHGLIATLMPGGGGVFKPRFVQSLFFTVIIRANTRIPGMSPAPPVPSHALPEYPPSPQNSTTTSTARSHALICPPNALASSRPISQ